MTPFPQTGSAVHTDGAPTHDQPDSTMHVSEHPSLADEFPSSHASPGWTKPFPKQEARQACQVPVVPRAGTKKVPAMQSPISCPDWLAKEVENSMVLVSQTKVPERLEVIVPKVTSWTVSTPETWSPVCSKTRTRLPETLFV